MGWIRELAQSVVDGGVDHVFGVPGGGYSLELIDELERLEVEFSTTVTEGSAAVMAAAWGRTRGKPGVAISIKGPGLTNLVPGLAAATLEALPVVAFCEEYPASTDSSVGHKRLDHGAICHGVARAHVQLGEGDVGYRELARLASVEVPGAVVGGLCGEQGTCIRKPSTLPAFGWDPAEASRRLDRARRPLLIVGTLALRRGWCGSISNLPIPVLTTAAAKGVADECGGSGVGVFTGVGGPLAEERALFDAADLVIGVGVRPQEILGVARINTPSVCIDPMPAVSVLGPSVVAVTDPSDIDLWSGLQARDPWATEITARNRESLRVALGDAFLPHQVYEAVAERFPTARLVVDTGDFCTISEHVWRASDPNAYLGSGQSRYMGLGIPMALGAAIADPLRPTVVAVGDGGVAMGFTELTLAVEKGLSLLVIYMCDGGFASIQRRARTAGLTEKPLRFKRSWLGAAAGLGLTASEATSADEVADSLAHWRPGTGPAFLQCTFDPLEYARMCDGLR